MKERPILMSGPNIQPIREDRKTHTRRIIKPQPQLTEQRLRELGGWVEGMTLSEKVNAAWQSGFIDVKCPHGQPGDRLWVKETFGLVESAPYADGQSDIEIIYRADGWKDDGGYFHFKWKPSIFMPRHAKWKPSIFMPRHASRILLEITDVRVERLQDISEEDAIAEGISRETVIIGANCNGGIHSEEHAERYFFDGCHEEGFEYPEDAYRALWESINGAGSWDVNPWVWVIIFRRIEP